MNYAEKAPAPPLSHYIERLWYYDSLDLTHSRERILPDGGFELIINLEDRRRKLFDRHDPSRYQLFHRGWISGAHAEHLVIDVLRGATMIGAHFRPGGAAPLLGMPADELTSKVVDLEAIWGKASWALRDALLESPTAQTKLNFLEAALLCRLKEGKGTAAAQFRTHDRVHWATRQLNSNPLRIPAVCSQLGISQKHFIDEFRSTVGLTPKRYARIRRFQKALAEIGARRQIDWSQVAFDCGYYDQAHFINDFQAFSGFTPQQYLASRLEYPNFARAD